MFNKEDVDSKQGIQQHLQCLIGMQHLRRKRQVLAENGVKLRSWILLGGIWGLDKNGNMGYGVGPQGCVWTPQLEFDVMDRLNFSRKKTGITFHAAPEELVPDADEVCTRCGKGWTPETSRDMVVRMNTTWDVMNRFAGLSIEEVLQVMGKQHRAELTAYHLSDPEGKKVSFTPWTIVKPGQNLYVKVLHRVHTGCMTTHPSENPNFRTPFVKV